MFSCSSCSFQTVSQDAYVQHVADHQKGLITPKETDRSSTDNGMYKSQILIKHCLTDIYMVFEI